MSSFDIIETSGRAYIKAWNDKSYFIRLAAFPFATKIIFFAIVYLLGFHENILRQTLVMLPAYFMEGWMIAHIVRYIVLGELWPVKLSGEVERDMNFIAARGRAVFAAIIVFVLIKMAQNALTLPFLINEDELRQLSTEPDAQASLMKFFVATMAVLGMIWGFKFLILYVPVAVDIPVRRFLANMKGMSSSLHLIGAWLTCYVPFLLVGLVLLNILSPLFMTNQTAMIMAYFGINFLVDMAATIVVVICFSYVLKGIFMGPPMKKDDRG